jgi:hypothetical protein
VTPPPVPPGTNSGSTVRLLIGAVLVIAAAAMAMLGFLQLIRVLEGGGYGTPAMVYALMTMGTAGALLAGGIATLIWDIAKRYESAGQPEVRQRQPTR